MSFFRKPTKFEWISLIVVSALFVWFLIARTPVARYCTLAAISAFFVGRIFLGSSDKAE